MSQQYPWCFTAPNKTECDLVKYLEDPNRSVTVEGDIEVLDIMRAQDEHTGKYKSGSNLEIQITIKGKL